MDEDSNTGPGPVRAAGGFSPGPGDRGRSMTVTTPYSCGMYAVHLTDAELETARHALQAYLLAFGHDEAETVGQIKSVIAKLRAAQIEDEDPRASA